MKARESVPSNGYSRLTSIPVFICDVSTVSVSNTWLRIRAVCSANGVFEGNVLAFSWRVGGNS